MDPESKVSQEDMHIAGIKALTTKDKKVSCSKTTIWSSLLEMLRYSKEIKVSFKNCLCSPIWIQFSLLRVPYFLIPNMAFSSSQKWPVCFVINIFTKKFNFPL